MIAVQIRDASLQARVCEITLTRYTGSNNPFIEYIRKNAASQILNATTRQAAKKKPRDIGIAAIIIHPHPHIVVRTPLS